MKKQFRIISFILLIALLMLSLSSCVFSAIKRLLETPLDELEGRERGTAFVERVNDRMNRVSSYISDIVFELELDVYGETLSITMTGTETIKASTFNLVYLEEIEFSLSVGREESMSYTLTEGFIDGKMISTYEDGEHTQKLYSALSKDEYIAYLEDTSDVSMDFCRGAKSAANMTVEQAEGDGWHAVFSGIGTDELAQHEQMMEDFLQYVSPNLELTDVVIDIVAEKNMYPRSVSLSYMFQKKTASGTQTADTNEEATPKIVMSMGFRDINSAKAPKLDLDGYTEVADLRVIETAMSALEEIVEREECEFFVLVSQKSSFRSDSSNSSTSYMGTLKNEDGKLSYRYTTGDTSTQYNEGEKVTKKGSKLISRARSNDETEKKTLSAMFDMGALSPVNLRDIEIEEIEGRTVYRFTLAVPDETLKEQVERAAGLKCNDATAVIEVIFEGGVLVEYEYTFTANMSFRTSMDSYPYVYELCASCEFS